MPKLAIIREGLTVHKPALAKVPGGPAMEAAVALILHEPPGGQLEFLLIERARSERDPWSGQMAFPGGRYETTDPDLAATAAREAHEEVGVRLVQTLGRLDDVTGGRGPDERIVVASYVYEVAERPVLRTNQEVSSAVWIPLRWILDPQSASRYRFEHEEFRGNYPAFRYEHYTVWGLTYRILQNFVKVVGRSLPSHQGWQSGQQEPD